MCLIGFSECFQLYDPGFIANPPRYDLPRMFSVIRFDNGPAAVRAVMAAPLEVVQVACGVDLSDDRIAIASIVG